MRALHPNELAAIQRLNRGSDIDCLPLKDLVSFFVRRCFDRGDVEFATADLREFIVAARFIAPRSGKPIAPSVKEIDAAILAQSSSSDALFVKENGLYQLPWLALEQQWLVAVNASDRGKAERVLERYASSIGREQGGFLRPTAGSLLGTWKVSFQVRLQALAWPCAVAEALSTAAMLAPHWSHKTGPYGISGAQLLSPVQPLCAAEWSLLPVLRGSA